MDNITVINNVMTTRILTLSAGTSNIMTTYVTTMHFLLKSLSTLKAKKKSVERSYDKQKSLSTLKAKKSLLKGCMINRTLHSWSFHMKFIKLAEGSFDKFHMK